MHRQGNDRAFALSSLCAVARRTQSSRQSLLLLSARKGCPVTAQCTAIDLPLNPHCPETAIYKTAWFDIDRIHRY